MFPLHQLVPDSLTDPISLPSSCRFAVLSLLSFAYMIQPSVNCFVVFIHAVAWARAFALAKAGNNMAARIAIMAMTTNNSINVKPCRKGETTFVRRKTVFMVGEVCKTFCILL